jgi:hypothetical protein
VTPVEAAYAALGAQDWGTYRKAMRLRCPWCKAHAGKPCTTMGIVLTQGAKVHPRRIEAAS